MLTCRKRAEIPIWPRLKNVPKELAQHSNSVETWNFIQDCLRNCTTNHSACCRKDLALLPKRVLDLRRFEELHISLSEPGEGERANYVALSYCWGGKDFVKTTTESIKLFKKMIDYHSMPAVFQEAIVIAKRLGVQYMWIDALCIVQVGKGSIFHLERRCSFCAVGR